MRNYIFFLIILFFQINETYGQEKEEASEHRLILSGYVDTYYAAHNREPMANGYQPLLTVGARDNSFGLNVAQFGLKYEHDRIRGEFIYHEGDIPGATWSTDFRQIQAANAGIRLFENIWLDAGFFPTHIGTESFLPKNNFLSSTAYLTYNEPFYQSGARIGFSPNDKWELQIWALNGYNRLVDNNKAKSLGIFFNYNFDENTSITYTNLFGKENEPRFTDQFRFYQNIYCNKNWSDKWYLSLGLDVGLQSNSQLSDPASTAYMYAGLVTIRRQLDEHWSVTARAETFNDSDGFISGLVFNENMELTGIETSGLTLGGEYSPTPGAYLRAELRYARSAEKSFLFVDGNSPENSRLELMFTIGYEIEKVFAF
jgi:hypothetical protein